MASNETWAFTEAKRRAQAMQDAYSIYRHKHNPDDFIVRNAAAAAPKAFDWSLVATFQSDGMQSFGK